MRNVLQYVLAHPIPPPTRQEGEDTSAPGPQKRTAFFQKLVVKLRPIRIIPPKVRYVLTGLIVLICFAVCYFLEGLFPQYYPFMIFLPAVILTSFIFDRGSGALAGAAGAILIYFFLMEPYNSLTERSIGEVVSTITFFLISLLTALIIEALRVTVDELSESLSKLVKTNQHLNDFVSIVSHDLKEPVRGIQSFSNFLLKDYEDKLDQEGKEQLHILNKLSKRMNDLINDLLLYSRAGHESRLAPLDLKELVGSVIEMMDIQLKKENAVVVVKDDLPTLVCDQGHVGEIFRNLITNGIKYNTNTEKRIEIGAISNHERNPGGYVFYVKDNGIGIAENQHEIIFKMFKRLHAQDKFGGGTGSGLAIVKKIIDQHGGEIWIDSKIGEGTTFYFYLACSKNPPKNATLH